MFIEVGFLGGIKCNQQVAASGSLRIRFVIKLHQSVLYFNPHAAGGLFGHYKNDGKKLKND